MISDKHPIRVFLCHTSSDKPAVQRLYERLINNGVDAWLDKEKVVPGQDWQVEITRAIRDSEAVIVCLSKQSVTKEGFVQKEIKFALDVADEKPEGTIFIIPTRLEMCDVPEKINKFHWVDLFADNGYGLLISALQMRANVIGATIRISKSFEEIEISRLIQHLKAFEYLKSKDPNALKNIITTTNEFFIDNNGTNTIKYKLNIKRYQDLAEAMKYHDVYKKVLEFSRNFIQSTEINDEFLQMLNGDS